MLVPILLFILGLILLVKGGGWFVDAASGIARRFNIPEFIIGATIVSVGTTLPEVMVSVTSASIGHGGLSYGNAVGSVICNAGLIAALPIALRPQELDRKAFRLPAAFFFIAAAVYMFSAYFLQDFPRYIGIILVFIFALYLYLNIRNHTDDDDEPVKVTKSAGEEDSKAESPIYKLILLLIVGAAFITVGADLLVDNGTIIAQAAGVPETVIALTFVSVGTSLPELVTAVTSVAKGHSSMSLGNILGANFIDIVLVSGLSILLSPFPLPEGNTIAGINSSLVLDLPLMTLEMLLLTLPVLIKGKTSRGQGIILLIMYAAFCALQFML